MLLAVRLKLVLHVGRHPYVYICYTCIYNYKIIPKYNVYLIPVYSFIHAFFSSNIFNFDDK